MTFYFFLFVTFLVLLHILHRYSRLGRMLDKIPGPTAFPFIGNILYANGSTEHVWYALQRLCTEYSRIVRVWLGLLPMVIIQHPDDVQRLFMSKRHLEKSALLTTARHLLHDGAFFSSGEKYRIRRKMIVSAFGTTDLKKYIEITNQCGDSLIEHLKSFGDEASHCLTVLWSDVMFNMSYEITVGFDENAIGIENVKALKHSLECIIDFQIYRITHPYLINGILPLFKKGREVKRQSEIFNKIVYNMYKKRILYNQQINKKSIKENDFIDLPEDLKMQDSNNNIKKRQSLLDKLLSFKEEGLIDEFGILEELNVLITAAYDTILTTATFTTMVFAENTDAQDRARAEVTEILDKTGGKITFTEVQQFKYLERCIKESLRMYPSAPLIIRYLTEDLQLENYVVPAGADVLVMIYLLHRNPDFWPDPEKFDPDRFLPENVETRHPYVYVPFSGGPRNCMGLNLALMQLKCLFAGILYNYRLEPIDRLADQRFCTHMTLSLTKPVHTKFVKINR